MPVRTTAVNVTTTAALIASADGASVTNLETTVIQNGTAVDIFIGGKTRGPSNATDSVTGGQDYVLSTANGYKIAAGQERSFDLGPGDDLWAVAGAAANGVIVMQFQKP